MRLYQLSPLISATAMSNCNSTVANLNPESLLTPQQAAQLLGMSIKTLATWRSTGRHALPFIRCGGRVRYRRSALNVWLESNSSNSAAEAMTGEA